MAKPGKTEKPRANEAKLKDDIVKMKFLENQLGLAQQQLIEFDRALQELAFTKNALEEMKKLPGKKETLVPIGSGMLAPSSMEKPSTVLTDVGAGVMIEKPIEEALKTLNEREKRLSDDLMKLQTQVLAVEQQYKQLASLVQSEVGDNLHVL